MIQLWANSFRFQDPLWLLLILPSAWLAWQKTRKRNRAAILFSSLSVFHQIPKTWGTRLLPIVRGSVWVGLILAVIALARPQRGEENYRVRSEGIAMAICLDRSGSMRTPDFVLDGRSVDRFTVVKKIFNDFVLGTNDFSGRPDDRIALVTFGGFVDSLCPLTLDHETLAAVLKMVQLPQPLVDQSGRVIADEIYQEESATAIGDALVAGVERLRESGAKSQVIILLSDGAQNTGAVTAEEAAEVAKTFGIRVYTIGIGTRGNAFEPLEFDEATLRQIAETTGGEYFSAQDTRTLQKVCETIDSLEKTIHEDRVFTRYRELYREFLIPGLAFLLIGTILLKTRFKSLPDG